jgi:hypothetical protein
VQESTRTLLDLAKARFDAGLGTALDVERAVGLLAAATSRRPELERLARRSSHRLGVLLGKEPAEFVSTLERPKALPPEPPELPVTLPSELLSRRPDLRRAEREVAAATARIGVARADLFPRWAAVWTFDGEGQPISPLTGGASCDLLYLFPLSNEVKQVRIQKTINANCSETQDFLARFETKEPSAPRPEGAITAA